MNEFIIPCLRCSVDAELRRCGDCYRVVCPKCGLKGARKCETARVGRGKAKRLAVQKWNEMQCNIVDAAIDARRLGILKPPYGANWCGSMYKGFLAYVKYDVNDNLYVGQVEGTKDAERFTKIKDTVAFHGKTLNECFHSFEKAVDNYLKMLEERK